MAHDRQALDTAILPCSVSLTCGSFSLFKLENFLEEFSGITIENGGNFGKIP